MTNPKPNCVCVGPAARRKLVIIVGVVVPERALLGRDFSLRGRLTDLRAGIEDLVDRGLGQREQQGVGAPEQGIVVGVGPAAREVAGQRHAVAALVERVHGLAFGQRVERVETDPLMQQHTVMIEGPGHVRVTPCYGRAKSGSPAREIQCPGLEPLDRALQLGLGLLAAGPVGGLHELARLEVLVVHEEVLDGVEFER